MSMIGNYRRISQAKLERLLAHPDELSSLLYPEGHDGGEPHLDIDKTWHIIHFLLNGQPWDGEWPLGALVMGGTEISDEDVGYGPARYLTPAEVREVSAAVNALPADALLSRFDSDAVRKAEIYPEGWSGSAEDRDYIGGYYTQLQAFFGAAAEAGEVMVIYLN
jgi:hypothetical protein